MTGKHVVALALLIAAAVLAIAGAWYPRCLHHAVALIAAALAVEVLPS